MQRAFARLLHFHLVIHRDQLLKQQVSPQACYRWEAALVGRFDRVGQRPPQLRFQGLVGRG